MANVPINPKNIQPRRIEPGPEKEDIKFQRHAFDNYLGENPLIHKPIKKNSELGGSKSLYDELGKRVRESLEALEELKTDPRVENKSE